MKLKAFILSLFLVLLFASGCKKNIDFFKPDHPDFDTTWLSQIPDGAPVNFLMSDLAVTMVTDSINVSNASEVSLSSGLSISFNQGSFVDTQNNAIEGPVSFNSSLFSKKGDIIRFGQSTAAENGLIDCSSISFLFLTQNNKPVSLKKGDSINIRYTIPYKESLAAFYLNNNVWERLTAPGNTVYPSIEGYQLRTSNLPWVCAGNIVEAAPQNKTYLKVTLPDNYTNTNSIAYLVLKNKNTAVRLLQNPGSHCFYYPGVPKNEEGMVLVLSRQVHDYYLGAVTFNSFDSDETLIKVKPIKKSFDDVMRFLSEL